MTLKKKYKITRITFIDSRDTLHYTDRNAYDLVATDTVYCTCCNEPKRVVKIVDREVIKELEEK